MRIAKFISFSSVPYKWLNHEPENSFNMTLVFNIFSPTFFKNVCDTWRLNFYFVLSILVGNIYRNFCTWVKKFDISCSKHVDIIYNSIFTIYFDPCEIESIISSYNSSIPNTKLSSNFIIINNNNFKFQLILKKWRW